MSTILKALRRLEEDKRARAAMSLDQAVLEPAVPQRPRNLWVGLGAGIAATLGAIAIAWSLSSLWLPAARSPMVAAEPSPPRASGEAEAVALAGAPEQTLQPIVPADPAASPGAGQPPAASLRIEPSTAAKRMEVFAKAQEVRREMQRLADAPVEGSPGADANTAAAANANANANAKADAKAEAVAAGATAGDVAAASAGVRRAPSARVPVRGKNAPKVKSDVLAARQERAKSAAASARAPEPAAAVSASPPSVAVQKSAAAVSGSSASVASQKSASVASGGSAGVAAPKSASAAKPSSPASTKSASGSSVASKSGSSASAAAAVAKVAVVERASDAVLSVQQIIWHPTPNRRVAVLQVEGDASPRRVGEGDVVAGFTVAKIGLSDVELVRDGVTVTRRLGSSSK